ncbi:MAG: hypothetical protein KatS3mg103_0814 [Phycisphaerales bacterium]|nr:MAG: hypothetical protein KatS3mg103_0814 [Phycisphaerales bacterium]
MMHGYAPIQLIPVTVLGFNFALIRAWRGSLVGAITAHSAQQRRGAEPCCTPLAFALYG